MATPDLLEKAKLAGLTQRANEDICSADNFSEKALTAVTYKDEKSPILFMRTPVIARLQ